VGRALKHWTIAASAGHYKAIHGLITVSKFILNNHIGEESIVSILTAYNNSCTEMRSDARDKYISELNGGRGVV
jgi:hypothetical protein